MLIEDGKGSGRKVQVDTANRLVTRSITIPQLEYINEDLGKVWSIPLDAVAPSGATYFFIIKNNGPHTISVCSIAMATSAGGVFRVSKVTGTPVGGTGIAPSNMNLNRTDLPDSILIESGTDITGLTESYLIHPLYIPTNSPFVYDSDSRLIITPGTSLAFKSHGAATVNGFVQFYEEQDALE